MHIGALPAYVSVHHFHPGTQGDQKCASESLECELEMVVSNHVGSGKQTNSLWKHDWSY